MKENNDNYIMLDKSNKKKINKYYLFLKNKTNKETFISKNIVESYSKGKSIIYLEKNFKIINERNVKLFANYHKSFAPKYKNSSRKYWENRYARGGNSGDGSYNNLALFKASVLNDFVKKNNINKVIEWGSGDCNQLSLENFKNYIGYDVSQTATINICKEKFINDKTKAFIYMNESFKNDEKADLSISLDVIYHLLEDNIFDLYMQNLFNSSNKYVCIYSSNIDMKWASHVRHRKFTDWIDKYVSDRWKIKEYIPNKYPFEPIKSESTSFADFYIYENIDHSFHRKKKLTNENNI